MNHAQYDVVIIGAGMVGLTCAALLAKHQFSVAVIEAKPLSCDWDDHQPSAHVSAINLASQKLLHYLGTWQLFKKEHYALLQRMSVWDHAGGGAIHFSGLELGESQLAYVIENRRVIKILQEQLQQHSAVDFFIEAPLGINIGSTHHEVVLSNAKTLRTQLIVGADGKHSWLRERLQIPYRERSYQQCALIAVTENQVMHRNTALQNFLPDGPLGVLPLANAQQTVFIWSCNPSRATELLSYEPSRVAVELNNALQDKLGEMRLLTPITPIPLSMRHLEQYVGPGFAFIGDAAHSIHPLAGQGANLGFMDAACLAQVLITAKNKSKCWFDYRVLRQYERWRKGYNQWMIMAMYTFKELFAEKNSLVVNLRSQGMHAVNHLSCLKKRMMRYASGLSDDLPDFSRSSSEKWGNPH